MERSKSNRLYRIWCWLWYNHDTCKSKRTVVHVCQRCGKTIVKGVGL